MPLPPGMIPPGMMPGGPPPMPPMGQGADGMPMPDITGMMASLSELAKEKRTARDDLKEAIGILQAARDKDPKLGGRISHAIAILRGDEGESADSPYFEAGLSSRRSRIED